MFSRKRNIAGSKADQSNVLVFCNKNIYKIKIKNLVSVSSKSEKHNIDRDKRLKLILSSKTMLQDTSKLFTFLI